MKNIIAILIVFTTTACWAQMNPYKLNKKDIPLLEIQEAIEYNLDYIKIEDSDYYRIYSYRSNNPLRKVSDLAQLKDVELYN